MLHNSDGLKERIYDRDGIVDGLKSVFFDFAFADFRALGFLLLWLRSAIRGPFFRIFSSFFSVGLETVDGFFFLGTAIVSLNFKNYNLILLKVY